MGGGETSSRQGEFRRILSLTHALVSGELVMSNRKRRDFVKSLAGLAGVGWLSSYMKLAAAEPPPEIKKIRLVHNQGICLAPQYVAEELLYLEGFTDVQYVEGSTEPNLSFVERGEADMTQEASPALVYGMDQYKSL